MRGHSGLAREELMGWYEQERVQYVLGLARNARLDRAFERAHALCDDSGQPERMCDEWMHSTLDS